MYLPAELQIPNGDSGDPVAVDPYVQQMSYVLGTYLFEVASGDEVDVRYSESTPIWRPAPREKWSPRW